MQELLQRIADKAGITLDQAGKAVDELKGYVKEKVPAVETMFHDLLHGKSPNEKDFGTQAKEFFSKAGDKAEDVLGDVKETISPYADKVEDLASKAYDKAGETFKDLGDKIGDFFKSDDEPKKA